MTPRLLLLFALLAAACAVEEAPPAEDPAADEAAIRALIDRTAALNNAADTTGWVALFEDGAVYMPPGSPSVTTRAGLEEAAAAGFGSYATDIRIVPDEVVVAGDWAFARSHVTGTATPRAGGDAVPVDVKQLVIYHRQADGAWKIARLITNSNG
ncbi:MAG: SgcJ/EcaC family oxidoreductase [Rhodothermales bacterium]|nr:SgcJ/EcaC family oxidoreductase [Rhodothermales bacterium]